MVAKMSDGPDKKYKDDDSISGLSATLFVAEDDSLASLLMEHGIKVRDFILLSFIADQGPMTVDRLARIVGVEQDKALRSLERLSAAGLVSGSSKSHELTVETVVTLAGRGQDVVRRIADQLP